MSLQFACFQKLPLPITQLSLAAVLQCGQSFRWSIFALPAQQDSTLPSHEYRLCLRDRVVCLRQSSNTLFYYSLFPNPPPSPTQQVVRDAETLAWINDYFQLDVDLQELYEAWSERDPIFRNIQGRFSGIRILRQDPWENLISFICSSNNNISRISKMVKSLCSHYSPPLMSASTPGGVEERETYHAFPPPSVLAAPEVTSTLRNLGFGYRADFIQKTAKMLVDEHGVSDRLNSLEEPAERWLTELRKISTVEARAELLKLMGVGRKVADCVLLMSLDKREVVPVDTHVHQIAHKHYGVRMTSPAKGGKVTMTPKLYDEVSTTLAEVWGEYAGWAHSVLFTADLKSFATYGLNVKTDNNLGLATPPDTPEPKRKRRRDSTKGVRKIVVIEEVQSKNAVKIDLYEGSEEMCSLADRVKRRRRIPTK